MNRINRNIGDKKISFLSMKKVAHPISALGGNATSNKLNFQMQSQVQSNWCWAAVSTSVSHYYHSNSSWKQCTVASQTLFSNGNSQCCGSNGSQSSCDQPWYLDQALITVNVYRTKKQSSASFTQVQAEISADNPLSIRVGWRSGGGHFLTIYGWQTDHLNRKFYDVDDPIFGSQTIPKNKLKFNYQNSGTWTHTYYTDAAPSLGGATRAGTISLQELGG